MRWLIGLLVLFLVAAGVVGVRIGKLEENQPSQDLASEVSASLVSNDTAKNLNENIIFEKVNNWREANGYPRYIKDERACKIAETRIGEVKLNWSHEDFKGYRWTNICPNGCLLGENLARDFPNEIIMIRWWIESPLHRRNLEESFEGSCVKCSGTICVHIFVRYN